MAGIESGFKVLPAKRKAESFAVGEECSRAAKKADCSEEEKQAPAAGNKGGEAPAKKMWRLPKAEVDWILAQPMEPRYPPFRDLKRRNPSLVPSPEEEQDEDMSLLYEATRICYESGEEYMVFQSWVRNEYQSKGFVEVDFDYFGQIAESQAFSDQARTEVFKDMDLSSDTEDEDDPFLDLLRMLRA